MWGTSLGRAGRRSLACRLRAPRDTRCSLRHLKVCRHRWHHNALFRGCRGHGDPHAVMSPNIAMREIGIESTVALASPCVVSVQPVGRKLAAIFAADNRRLRPG